MNETTRYKYEKRIKELEILRDYRRVCMNIFYALEENGDNANGLSKKWLLSQFRGLFK